MRRDLAGLTGEDLIKEAQHRAAFQQKNLWYFHYRLKEVLMVVANMAMNFYCADSFTERHTAHSKWLNDFRVTGLFVLMAGTAVGNFFAKVPVLIAIVNGLGFNAEQKRIYRAVERGIEKSKLLLARGDTLYCSMTPEDLRALCPDMDYRGQRNPRNFILMCNLLEALYEIKLVIRTTQSMQSNEFDSETVRDDGEAGVAMGDAAGGMATASLPIELRLNHSQSVFGPTDNVLNESSLSDWQTLRQHPGDALYYGAKWFTLRLGASLAVILSINHSFHNILQSWCGLKNTSHAGYLWFAMIVGLGVGDYRALAANSLVNHKLYKEINLLDGRRQLKIKPAMNWRAVAVAALPITINMFFNTSMTIFFGNDGLKSLFEQAGWLWRREAYDMPQWMGHVAVGWFMIGNITTAMSSTQLETYRKLECSFEGKSDKRINDSSTQVYPWTWRLAMLGMFLDSVNYGLVGSNSTDSAWRSDKLLGPETAYAFALLIGAAVTVTSMFWSRMTGLASFSGVMKTVTGHSHVKSGIEGLDESDAAADGLLRRAVSV
ncbi:MAG: hypothetical protein P1U40_13550 [Coxiellaceae bacterium]|nr:hypothetical protein [Coxiellaceae bacterium]